MTTEAIPLMPHVLNYGMGVESTAILLRWLLEPETRPFDDLGQLVVLVAQTGNEFPTTKALVEAHLFPLLRRFQIRVVEVAKRGPFERDGYTILSDTRKPQELHTEGDYRLSQNLHEIGTVPMYSGPHTCAMKWKGFVIDCWLRDHLGSKKFGPYLGYNADEQKRADKCDDYRSRGNEYRFPLIEWGWDRHGCIDYLREKLGVTWLKSCCSFCPFIDKKTALQRYQDEPDQAGFALFTEFISLALNPRMQLFAHGRAYDLIIESGNRAALQAFRTLLEQADWAIYRVERTWERKIGKESGKPFTRVNRRVKQALTGSRIAMDAELSRTAEREGLQVDNSDEALRVYSHQKRDGYPACEGFWVVAPDTVKDKVRNERNFQKTWDAITGSVEQLTRKCQTSVLILPFSMMSRNFPLSSTKN